MQHIAGIPRNQIVFMSLEEPISNENPVRFVDPFVVNLDLKSLGFSFQTLKTEGRPSFSKSLKSHKNFSRKNQES